VLLFVYDTDSGSILCRSADHLSWLFLPPKQWQRGTVTERGTYTINPNRPTFLCCGLSLRGAVMNNFALQDVGYDIHVTVRSVILACKHIQTGSVWLKLIKKQKKIANKSPRAQQLYKSPSGRLHVRELRSIYRPC